MSVRMSVQPFADWMEERARNRYLHGRPCLCGHELCPDCADSTPTSLPESGSPAAPAARLTPAQSFWIGVLVVLAVVLTVAGSHP